MAMLPMLHQFLIKTSRKSISWTITYDWILVLVSSMVFGCFTHIHAWACMCLILFVFIVCIVSICCIFVILTAWYSINFVASNNTAEQSNTGIKTPTKSEGKLKDCTTGDQQETSCHGKRISRQCGLKTLADLTEQQRKLLIHKAGTEEVQDDASLCLHHEHD